MTRWRWPWRAAPVEHRSSYTDQVVTAILAAASGGGVRPALATAAVESCATLVRERAVGVRGVGASECHAGIDRRLARVGGVGAHSPRSSSSTSSGPIRSTVSRCGRRRSFDVYGTPDPPWVYRISRSGPSTTTWQTYSSESVLHLRWLVDHARPWAGVSPLQRASDTAGVAGWLEKRLAEEASGPTGSFLPVARYEPAPDADLADPDADDPLAALRRDIGAARGQTLLVETAMASADSPASAPRKDFQVARFGANPPQGLIELREKVTLDIGAACGVPRGLLDASTGGQASREAWRQFVSTSVDGLARRIEAQVLAQLGVEIRIDSTPLAGRDLAARAAAFATARQGRCPRCRRAGSRPGSSVLSCEACGNTWSPASGASCPACLTRGRGRDADGKLQSLTRAGLTRPRENRGQRSAGGVQGVVSQNRKSASSAGGAMRKLRLATTGFSARTLPP